MIPVVAQSAIVFAAPVFELDYPWVEHFRPRS
jgi:hypothetical protein